MHFFPSFFWWRKSLKSKRILLEHRDTFGFFKFRRFFDSSLLEVFLEFLGYTCKMNLKIIAGISKTFCPIYFTSTVLVLIRSSWITRQAFYCRIAIVAATSKTENKIQKHNASNTLCRSLKIEYKSHRLLLSWTDGFFQLIPFFLTILSNPIN